MINLLRFNSNKLFLVVVTIMLIFQRINSDVAKASISNIQNQITSSQSHFITKNSTRIIAQKGGLAILPCVIKQNSPATVSWIRKKDFQLLTVGLSTHSSDKRFLVEHTRHMGHWSLRIKSVRDDDQGFYECQLSIYPTQSIFIELRVVEAVAEIAGTSDLHIDEGSTLRLECKLKRATENPSFIFWYHNNKMVNYDLQNGFSVKSINNEASNANNEFHTKDKAANTHGQNLSGRSYRISYNNLTINSGITKISLSILTIKKVYMSHGGNYTCAPANAKPSSITVHVLRGERPAAMQHSNRSTFEGEMLSNGNSLNTSSTSLFSSSSGISKQLEIDKLYNLLFLIFFRKLINR